MSRDEALQVVVPLDSKERMVLLEVLLDEMNVEDADVVVAAAGYSPNGAIDE